LASSSFAQRAFLVGLVRDRAGHDLALAGTAGAVLAAVGQADAGADGRRQHGFVFLAAELVAAGLYSDLERHTIFRMKNLNIQKFAPRPAAPADRRLRRCRHAAAAAAARAFSACLPPPASRRCAELRALGAVPLVADLDQPATLRACRAGATVVHLAPPPADGVLDSRTRNLTAILPEGAGWFMSAPRESTAIAAARCSTKAVRWRRATRARCAGSMPNACCGAGRVRAASTLSILRVPGIYAADRLPLKRLQQGTPALRRRRRVHQPYPCGRPGRLSRCPAAGAANRVYHAVDDSDMKMAQYFDAVADAFQLPRPPRLPRAELQQVVTPALLSFMSESRRLSNDRIKRELGVRLRYPMVGDLLHALR
jgi:hypothetical protein